MEELMKSFGLFADDNYWFVTEEDHVRGNFLVITYPDRIIANITVKVINNKIYYKNLECWYTWLIAKEDVEVAFNEMFKFLKDEQVKEKLNNVRSDFV